MRCASEFHLFYYNCSSTSTALQALLGNMRAGNQKTLIPINKYSTRDQRGYDQNFRLLAEIISSQRRWFKKRAAPQNGILSSHVRESHGNLSISISLGEYPAGMKGEPSQLRQLSRKVYFPEAKKLLCRQKVFVFLILKRPLYVTKLYLPTAVLPNVWQRW